MKNKFHVMVEYYFRIEHMLYAFWTMFWVLNGLDKFFNGVTTEGPFGLRPVGWLA